MIRPLYLCLLSLAAICVARAADLRVGMIGLDTSHVVQYLNLLNDPKHKDHVPGAKIVAGFKGGSPDIESSRSRVDGFTQTAVEKFGVKMYDSIEELAKNVDAIIILAVDGRPHLDQFRRTLAAKKPVFIDKPLAGSLKDALEIARLSKAHGVPVFSSSSLRYTKDSPMRDPEKVAKIGPIASAISFGPAELEPHHPDMFWYGIHAVEALYSVLGPGCERVVRTHTKNTDVITGVWSDGRVGTMQGNRNGRAGYGVTVIGSKGKIVGGEQHSYRPLVEAYLKFFQTGVSPVPLETTIELLAFMEAADESKRRGGAPVTIAEVMRLAK